MTNETIQKLRQEIPTLTEGELLSRHSTIRVGGPATVFATVKTTAELIHAVQVARNNGVTFHVLGGGSNTLFSDHGFDGLVIKNMANSVVIAGAHDALLPEDTSVGEVRHEAAEPGKYVSFLDLNYDERPGDTLVQVESGVNLTALIVRTLDADLTGLEWFGGIPGVIGGAVYNNIHGGTHFIADRITSVMVLREDNTTVSYEHDELDFGYDHSRFHETGEIILNCNFLLTKATAPELERADRTFREWVKRKSQIQPKTGSLGSTFQNISQEMRQKIGAPTTSAGWLIEQVGLKGHKIGGARISLEHANFIVNEDKATALDVYNLIELCKEKVKKRFGVDLHLEVFLIGEF